MTVEVRRRSWLVATIAVLTGVVSVGYLWRFAAVGGGLVLGMGLLLGAVALSYVVAWFGARTPLLVADGTGLRVRLGSGWVGVPWDEVDRVSVTPAGRVHDGRVLVLPADESASRSGIGRRPRFEAAWNRTVYGAALAVPYGLATTVSTTDLPAALRSLAEGRAEVVVLDENKRSGPLPGQEPHQPVPAPPTERLPPPAAAASAPPAGFSAQSGERKPVVALPLRRLAGAAVGGGGVAQPARREEVTIAMRRTSVDGSLALSAPSDEVLTEELPEISELRRSAGPAEPANASDLSDRADAVDGAPGVGKADGGNIALIIDATTDLSARAMRKVRRPPPEPVEPIDSEPELVADQDEPSHILFLGSELRRARENLSLSVDDLADRTRIRPFVIECMEADDFSPCGGDFYARGHLRMLARVLGVASEPLIETYDERFARSPVSLRDVFDVELATGATGMVRGGAAGANWGGLIAAVLILVLIWGVARFFADESTAAPTPPSGSTSSQNSGGP